MKVHLTLQERVYLFEQVSKFDQNNIAVWRAIEEAKKTLSLGKEDLEVFGIKTITNDKGDKMTVTENEKEAKERKEYDLPERLVVETKDFLEKNNKEKKLTHPQFCIYEALNREEEGA